MGTAPARFLYVWHDGAVGVTLRSGQLLDRVEFRLEASDGVALAPPSFRAWLEGSPGARVHLIVDTIDESHVTEDLPRLGLRDRDALLRKRIRQRFREAEFVNIRSGRTARLPRRRRGEGGAGSRPGSQAFLSALTNEEILKPWLETLLASRSRIRTLTSPALLAPRLLTALARQPHGLLLSQGPAGLRQTLVLDGAIAFSRLAILHDASASAVIAEINRTIQYLTSSRRVSNESLAVERFAVWVVEPGLQCARDLPGSVLLDNGLRARMTLLPSECFPDACVDRVPGLAPWIRMLRDRGAPQYATERLRFHDRCVSLRRALWSGAAGLAALGLTMSLGGSWIADLALPDTSAHERVRENFDIRAMELSGTLAAYGVSAAELGAIVDGAAILRARNVDSAHALGRVARGMEDEHVLKLSRVRWQRQPLQSLASSGVDLAASMLGPAMAPGAAPAAGVPPMPAAGPAAADAPRLAPIELAIRGEVDRQIGKTEANDRVAAVSTRLLTACDCANLSLTLPYDPAPAAALSERIDGGSQLPLAFEAVMSITPAASGGAR